MPGGAHSEYFLSKLGVPSIADRRVAAARRLVDSLNQPRAPRRSVVPLRADGSVADAQYITEESYSNEHYSRNVSFSYQSPVMYEEPAPPLQPALRTSTYNSEEALQTLRALRKKNNVDFSQFWGWERKQRALLSNLSDSAASVSSGPGSGSGSSSSTLIKPSKAADEVSKRVQAVRNMQAVYAQGGGISDPISSLHGLDEEFASTAAAFTSPAPQPISLRVAAAAAAASGEGVDEMQRDGGGFRQRKPRIADLVLTDEHFDAVSKYFSSPINNSKNNIYAEAEAAAAAAGPGLGLGVPPSIGVESGDVLRVSAASASAPSIYIYSPSHAASSSSSSGGKGGGSGSTESAGLGSGSGGATGGGGGRSTVPTPTGLGPEDSLDDLLQFMSAVEGEIK